METVKTRNGWAIEITNTVNGMLEQGGGCGRRVLYLTDTLAKLGIDYAAADPDDDWNDYISIEEFLIGSVAPDNVLRKGAVIE